MLWGGVGRRVGEAGCLGVRLDSTYKGPGLGRNPAQRRSRREAKGPGAAGGRGWTNREEAGRRRPGKDLAFIPNALEKPL